tara:strand:+ start:672 stop:1463 length:792 start_codon:yes stop_codon:yes gene_type:complete
MIKLLTPISHHFENIESVENIIDISDELEARERTCHLNLKNTTHYHIDFDLNIGLSNDQIEFLIKHVKPRENIHTLTFQAARDCEEVKLLNKKYHPVSRPIGLNEQILNTKKSIKIIKDIVGSDRNIGIENNNYYPTGAYDICTSESYLIEVCQVNNIHLLFDYAHAMVTSFNRNFKFKDYSDSLLSNLDCTQVHICEPTFTYNEKGEVLAEDSHNLPKPNTTQNLLELTNKFQIKYITVEFYKDAVNLLNYMKYLKKSLNNG